jgi:hypothetical protein
MMVFNLDVFGTLAKTIELPYLVDFESNVPVFKKSQQTLNRGMGRKLQTRGITSDIPVAIDTEPLNPKM